MIWFKKKNNHKTVSLIRLYFIDCIDGIPSNEVEEEEKDKGEDEEEKENDDGEVEEEEEMSSDEISLERSNTDPSLKISIGEKRKRNQENEPNEVF